MNGNILFRNLRSRGTLPAQLFRTYVLSTNEQSNISAKLKMMSWQLHGYGEKDELQCATAVKIPKINTSSDCLIRVLSTSVNPIDVAMLGGYGSKLLNVMRCQPDIEFPLTLGREFCGELVQRGMGGCTASNHIGIGDRVWGVVPVHLQGSHAEYVVVPETCISHVPDSLSNEEAAAVLYAGLTAWSGLFITGGIGGVFGAIQTKGLANSSLGKRVLVLGGSGSVGSLAIQMLKAEGAEVVATCSEDAISMVKSFGANVVIDYKNDQETMDLKNYSPYDIVLDCAGQGESYAKSLDFSFKQYITFSSPLLRNIDEAGVAGGLVKNIYQLLESNATSITSDKGLVKWGFFIPAPQGIEYLGKLVDRKKLLPNVEKAYNFEEMPEAFQHVKNGHLRGKIIVNVAT